MARSKYINTFNTTADYNNYIESALPEFPNVAYDKQAGEVKIMRTSPNNHLLYGELVDATQNIPDIQLYNNSSKVKTYTPTVDTLTKEFYIDDWETVPTFNKLASNFLTNKSNIKSIKKFKGLNTSSVTNMSSMFYGCTSLTSVDLSNFNTPSLTDMTSMFSGCSSLTSVDLSSFDTSSVVSIYNLFNGCSSLTSVNLNNCNFSNVTNEGNWINASVLDLYINIEATLMKLTNNLTGGVIKTNTTIHYDNSSEVIDYKWQNNAWTPQS